MKKLRLFICMSLAVLIPSLSFGAADSATAQEVSEIILSGSFHVNWSNEEEDVIDIRDKEGRPALHLRVNGSDFRIIQAPLKGDEEDIERLATRKNKRSVLLIPNASGAVGLKVVPNGGINRYDWIRPDGIYMPGMGSMIGGMSGVINVVNHKLIDVQGEHEADISGSGKFEMSSHIFLIMDTKGLITVYSPKDGKLESTKYLLMPKIDDRVAAEDSIHKHSFNQIDIKLIP